MSIFCDPHGLSQPGSLSIEFSKQEYWVSALFLSRGLLDSGVRTGATCRVVSFPSEPQVKFNISRINTDNAYTAGVYINTIYIIHRSKEGHFISV